MSAPVQEYYDFVMPLVKKCGEILLSADNVDVQAEAKTEVWDYVTEYDLKIEAILISGLKERYPHHKFVGEEESEVKGIDALTDSPTWFIDPIDGTSNFIKKMRMSVISVGLVINKEQVMGIAYNPYAGQCYTAIKGQGAYVNGKRIRTSGVTEIKKSIFNYELSLAVSPKYTDLYLYRLKHLIPKIRGIRSLGCAVIGLCWVAEGKLDAYQCDGLFPWDAAAGVLIVREAGGYVCDSRGKEFNLMDPQFLASSTKVLSDQYMEIERRADEERLNVKNQ